MTNKNNVHIKDLPYEFLKDQPSQYFESQEYGDMVSLFDSKKVAAPLTTTAPSDPAVPDIIISHTASLIANKYLGVRVIATNENDLSALVYVKMQSKINVTMGSQTKPIRRVTKDVRAVPKNVPAAIRRQINSSIVRRFSNAAQKTAAVTVDPQLLRPAKTLNPALDVVSGSKFYRDTVSSKVFDDRQYAISRINEAIEESTTLSPHGGMEVFRQGHDLSVVYAFEYKDLRLLIDMVRKATCSKYAARLNGADNRLTSTATLRDSLRMNLLRPVEKKRYAVYTFSSSAAEEPSDEYTLDHGMGSTNFLSGVITLDSQRQVTSGPAAAVDADTATISFDSPRNITATLLADRESGEEIRLERLLDQTDVAVRSFSFGVSDTWHLEFDSLDEGFVLQASDLSGSAVVPVSVTLISSHEAVVSLPSPTAGMLYLLASVENCLSDSHLVVSESNVANVLATTNFFEKAFTSWN